MPLEVRYVVPDGRLSAELLDRVPTLPHPFDDLSAGAIPGTWRGRMPWTARAFGVIGREVEEKIDLSVSSSAQGAWVACRCDWTETHQVHAVSVASAAGLAGLALVALGLPGGVLPAATVAVGGFVVADVGRAVDRARLTAQLRIIAVELGQRLWPGAPHEIHPKPPSPLLGR